MKDIYKNPILYYILVPIVVALWPLFVWGLYLPEADKKLEDNIKRCDKTDAIIEEILKLDRDRLEFADSKNNTAEFDYANAAP
ncbi:unnamed protein product [marine sediment metagenome]|uniref:Uncharacterized protein n=1 Tax=marine sediment metagenome TaxID=412755 RepID=X1MNH8_9ZZZZ